MEEPLEKYKYKDRLELDDLQSETKKKFEKICCPSCSKDIEAQDLNLENKVAKCSSCLLYTSPSPRDRTRSRMPSSA